MVCALYFADMALGTGQNDDQGNHEIPRNLDPKNPKCQRFKP